jgi:DNA-binding NtrC family response regulator
MGSERTFIPDVRWIIGLQRSPEELIAEGRLRPDLAARWGQLRIVVPPLRERLEDIAQLAPHLLARMAEEEGAPVVGLSGDVLAHLMGLTWPGNVRELDGVLYAAFAAAMGEHAPIIRLHHLPDAAHRPARGGPRLQWLDQAAIQAALAASDGVLTDAALRLGVDRRTLYRRLRRSGAPGPLRGEAGAMGG